MQKRTIITIAAVAGAILVLRNAAKKTEAAFNRPAIHGADDFLSRPRAGRWVTAQRLRYDPTPSITEISGPMQYRNEVINDLSGTLYGEQLAGLGRSWISKKRKIISRVARASVMPAVTTTKLVAQGVKRSVPTLAKVGMVSTMTVLPAVGVHRFITRRSRRGGRVVVETVDPKTNEVVKVEPAPEQPTPPGGSKSPYSDSDYQQATDQPGAPRRDTYNSSDYEDGAPRQAPAMPENVTSVETPSAEVDPAEPPAEEPKKGIMPWLVGGGLVAAVVAANS